jgi:hypothetical protein
VQIEGPIPVVASDVQILFDTEYLEGVSVTDTGTLNGYFIDNSDPAGGKIWFGGGTWGSVAPTFQSATLTFRAKSKLGTTALTFNLAETDIQAADGTVLGAVQDGSVRIGLSGMDTIAVRPETKTVAPGETFTLDVKIEGPDLVVGSDVQILFDTQYLEGVSVVNSGVLNSYFIDNSDLPAGKIWFGGGKLTPVAPPFTFATLTFKAKSTVGITNLPFSLAETFVEGMYGSVLGGAIDGEVTVADPNVSVSLAAAEVTGCGSTRSSTHTAPMLRWSSIPPCCTSWTRIPEPRGPRSRR